LGVLSLVWDNRFIELAKLVASWSKDPSTQVGSVLTRDKSVVSLGFNGFPAGINDDTRLNNRELKYKMIIHAEINAMLSAKQPLSGCTLYVWPFMPCSNCMAAIIQAGIRRVVSVKNTNERWRESFELTKAMCKESGVKLVLYE
jgi:dCMP deaminase